MYNGLSLISIWWHCQKAWYDIKPTNCKQKPFLFLCQIVNQFTLNWIKSNLKYFGVRNRNVRPVSQVPAQIIITRPTKMLAVCGAAVRGLNQHDFIRQLTNHSPGLASCDLSDQSCPSIWPRLRWYIAPIQTCLIVMVALHEPVSYWAKNESRKEEWKKLCQCRNNLNMKTLFWYWKCCMWAIKTFHVVRQLWTPWMHANDRGIVHWKPAFWSEMIQSTDFVPCEIYNRKQFVSNHSLSHFSDQSSKNNLVYTHHVTIIGGVLRILLSNLYKNFNKTKKTKYVRCLSKIKD